MLEQIKFEMTEKEFEEHIRNKMNSANIEKQDSEWCEQLDEKTTVYNNTEGLIVVSREQKSTPEGNVADKKNAMQS